MARSSRFSESYPRHADRRSGFALIIVLAAVVLLTMLVVFFFLRVQSDTQSSSAFQAGLSVQNLREQAVNLVMAQIKSATSSLNADGSPSSTPLAWASQPGMIRTFNNQGGLVAAYKLYSSGTMTAGTVAVEPVPNSWNGFSDGKPFNALWCDLNSPVRVAGDADGSGTIATGEKIPMYPILDPNAEGTVKGFSLSDRPGFSGSFVANSYAGQDANRNPAPMPVRWLYILRDGQMIPPGGTNGAAVSIAGASATNPIVGRIAFWTDDESCKININTAAGGPWIEPAITSGVYSFPSFSGFNATPVTATVQDRTLATNQPAQFEYQRYPGHPATTFLSAALPSLDTLDKIYALAPRIVNEGSKGGTVATALPSSAPAQIRPDGDRLYSSVGELAFDTARNRASGLSRSQLEQAKFFLTANSRSPEVNLFNEPRIGLWPINGVVNKRTPFDRLIEFCQTINNDAYYFVRNNADSATEDIELERNQDILGYLRRKTTTAVPGFGGGSSGILGKYGEDSSQILTEVFDYIRSTNTKDSSQGGTEYFYAETGAVVPAYDDETKTRGFGRFPTVTKAGILFYGVGIKIPKDKRVGDTVTPGAPPGPAAGNPYPPDSRGVVGDDVNVRALQDGSTTARETADLETGKIKMRAILFLEMFTPGQGSGWVYPRMKVEVDGLSSFTWPDGGGTMFDNPTVTLNYNGKADWEWGYPHFRNWGGRVSLRALAGKYSANGASTYPLAGTRNSPAVACRTSDDTNPTFLFSGGTLKVRILTPDDEELQKIEIPFPSTTCPVPELAPYAARTPGNAGTHDFTDFRWRLHATANDQQTRGAGWEAWITDKDVVRAVAVDSGDFRLVAGQHEVTTNPKTGQPFFQPHPFYADRLKMLAHNFIESNSSPYYGAGLGTYPDQARADTSAAGTKRIGSDALLTEYGNDWNPAAASGEYRLTDQGFTSALRTHVTDTLSLDGVKVGGEGNLQGDWDLGMGFAGEGPYINFADEGNVANVAGEIPYFGDEGRDRYMTEAGPSSFSPNRIMPSAAMLGSLPTGVKSGKPWQTLLFRPSAAGHAGAYSSGTTDSGYLPQNFSRLPDYLLLDLFNMPVVEPYAISEPLSTAGKVNMNYRIQPFDYIQRSTGVQAVLRSEQMLAMPNSRAAGQKFRYNFDQRPPSRHLINLEETLKGFQKRFDQNDVFRSPAEICSIWLVPASGGFANSSTQGSPPVSYDGMATWWDGFLPTADNAKESSYARIYPRLTTKSNTYTVHYRVQALRKPSTAANQAQWNEETDKVVAEFRGSTTIERYVDPNDGAIPDYIADPAPEALSNFYKFRVISQKQFNP